MSHDVVVIGGGFAGTVALRELTAIGHDAVLLEARDRLGGRGYLQRGALRGLDLEMGCQFFQRRYEHVNAEIERYRVPYHSFSAGLDADHWLMPDGEMRQGGLPIESGSLPDLEDLLFALRTLAERIDLTVPWSEQFPGTEGARWDISVDAWMDGLETPSEVRELFQLALSPWLVTPRPERSLLYLARMVAADGGLFRYLMGENLILEEGTTDLVERIAADGGAPVHLNTPVRRIVQDPSDDFVHMYTDGGEVSARVVVCTVPVAVLADIVFEPTLDPIRLEAAQVRSGGEGTKIWSLVRNVPSSFMAVAGSVGVHTLVRMRDVDDCALVLAFGTADPWLDGHDTDAVQREYRRFFPDAEVVDSMGHDWLSDPWTKNSNPFPRPGDVVRHQSILTRPEGRVVFAGSETSLRRPGFVDGAIETGARAAHEAHAILERTSVQEPVTREVEN